MRKNGIIVLLLLLLGGGIWFFIKRQNEIKIEENATIILNKIEEVNKLILVEGSFSEIYSYSQAENIFFNLLPVEKKVLVIVNAKASVGYDLSKVDYHIDKELKQVVISNLPQQEILIEPDIQYYDIQQNQFYPLNAKDLTTINKRVVALIENQVKESVLPTNAEKRLDEVLEQIIFTGTSVGWQVIKD